jgi:CHAT domain-containing protein
VFHFAGHSIGNASQDGLLLSPEGSGGTVLVPTSLSPRMLSACSLVVLSACSTEGLFDDALADPRSVPVVLLRAGVPHIVASAWNINSRSTLAFMNAFYDALLKTGSATGAVRLAEVALSRATATSHPYYWAAFKVWGEF